MNLSPGPRHQIVRKSITEPHLKKKENLLARKQKYPRHTFQIFHPPFPLCQSRVLQQRKNWNNCSLLC